MAHNGWLAEDAYKALRENEDLIVNIVSANEDTTRLRAIDTILFDVLRWDKSDVETEKYVRSEGFADYVFGSEPNFTLVLEAKREGVSFSVDTNLPTKRALPFDLIAKECPGAANALRQAVGYATQLGSIYTAISNGHQWILAMSYVQGVPIESRSVILFSSFAAIKDHFRDFWNTFSPLAIKQYLPTPKLLETRFNPPPPKLSSPINGYPAAADRNTLRNELGSEIELIWDEVTERDSDADFLAKCYIKPSTDADDIRIATEIIKRHEPSSDAPPSNVVPMSSLETKTIINNNRKTSTQPIIVLGRVGHGKSIYLKYLRNIDAAQHLKNYVQLDVDFLDRPDTPDDVPQYIYNEIDRQLNNDYSIDIQSDEFAQSVLNLDLKRFRKTSEAKTYADDPQELAKAELSKVLDLQSDRHTYFGKALHHIRAGRKHSLAIFFDNLDRRDDKIQEAAFIRASAIARDWDALLFICLRPGTFQRSRSSGTLDSLAPRLITVSPPRTDVFLRRRFQYGAELSREYSSESSGANITRDEREAMTKVATMFDVLDESFKRNRSLGELFHAVANGNARFILFYIRQVICSGHLNTSDILATVAQEGRYIVAHHQTLRSLLYGDYRHYDPNHSPLINLFDIEHSEPREHFTRFVTLSYLTRAATGDSTHGYRDKQEIESYLCSIGYVADHARSTLRELFNKKCIEGDIFDDDYDQVGDRLRITSLGRYLVNDLVGHFLYLDAITVDLPILDADLRSKIKDVNALTERLARAREVLRYLNKCSERLNNADVVKLWALVHDRIASDITNIEISN